MTLASPQVLTVCHLSVGFIVELWSFWFRELQKLKRGEIQQELPGHLLQARHFLFQPRE